MRRYEFRYQTDTFNGLSILTGIEVFGFNDKQTKISAKVAELPPLTFAYTKFEPRKRRFQPVSGADLPAPSFANPDLELVDLFGNGLPDIIEMKGTVRYWRNLGRGRFDLPRHMRNAPPYALSDPGVQIIDADGDGRADVDPAKSGNSHQRKLIRGYRAYAVSG